MRSRKLTVAFTMKTARLQVRFEPSQNRNPNYTVSQNVDHPTYSDNFVKT